MHFSTEASIKKKISKVENYKIKVFFHLCKLLSLLASPGCFVHASLFVLLAHDVVYGFNMGLNKRKYQHHLLYKYNVRAVFRELPSLWQIYMIPLYHWTHFDQHIRDKSVSRVSRILFVG